MRNEKTREITVFVILQEHMKYTPSRTKLSLFIPVYIFITCKFVITEARTYNIAHDENALSSLIIQSIQ